MIAHKRHADGAEQPMSMHSRNTARLCAAGMAKLELEMLGYLAGLLHDMGKCRAVWQRYFLDRFDGRYATTKDDVHHAPTGAIFVFERWYSGSHAERAAAQMLAMVIYGHHSGLMDAFGVDGTSPLLAGLAREKNRLGCNEAMEYFYKEVCTPEELDQIFLQAAAEIDKKQVLLNDFSAGLLMRTLLGALVDADRFDSACFAFGEDPFAEEPAPDWAAASAALGKTLSNLSADAQSLSTGAALAEIRHGISDACLRAAPCPPGVFRLTVPTGGGKTLSSLRFALRHAEINEMRRIFYISPFNTILDQNSGAIRSALGKTVSILEHHCNVVYDDKEEDGALEQCKKLTERWRSDLVLTSMNHFLDTFYSKKNADARRASSLARSVIIFDEVQSLPKKCVRLFEKAVRFLTELCGCTVVLCTATQPLQMLEASEIVPDTQALFTALRRTRLIDETDMVRSGERAAADVMSLIRQHGAVLMIVNTKRMAHRMYELVHQSGIACIHLSTDMYPEHRTRLLERIAKHPKDEPLFCVSTALIEAGINISFPCVVRCLAGLGSILQAAGRCNRNAELPVGTLGTVYLWRLLEERLIGVPEIAQAQACTMGFLAARSVSTADLPEGIRAYYAVEREKFKALLPYPARVDGVSVTLLDILGSNKHVPRREAKRLVLRGAYRTAEGCFRVISNDTVPVLVEQGEGVEIAAKLAGDLPMNRKLQQLRKAQRYSVSLFSNVFFELASKGAIWTIESAGVSVLRGEYYNPETGLTMEAQVMEDLQF